MAGSLACRLSRAYSTLCKNDGSTYWQSTGYPFFGYTVFRRWKQ